MHRNTLFLSLVLLFGCSTSPSAPEQPRVWQELAARNLGDSLERPLIYRAIVPEHWKRKNPDPSLSIKDTTKPIAEFLIYDGEEIIRLTLHTFPISEAHPRVSAKAQINRWKEQFDELDPLTTRFIKETHGGFSGLFLEASGLFQGKATSLFGWSMQLAPEYTRLLDKGNKAEYKMADYTIKALGPNNLMQKHRQEIMRFAHSFELIDELPAPC